MINPNDILTLSDDSAQAIEYNNPLFHCFFTQVYFSENTNYHVTEHWHEDLEFLYVKEGEFRCSVNGENMIIHEGEGMLINSKRIHSNGTLEGKRCAIYCSIINPMYMRASHYIDEKYVSPLLDSGSFDYLWLRHDDWTETILNNLINSFENDCTTPIELKIIEFSFNTLGVLNEHFKPDNTQVKIASPYEDTFKAMVTYINDHYSEKLSLADIAASGNVGKTLCTNIFKKYANKTPGDYLIHYRIMKSMELLANRDINITEVAYRVGFNSASHYTEIFKQIIGKKPGEIRKKALRT